MPKTNKHLVRFVVGLLFFLVAFGIFTLTGMTIASFVAGGQAWLLVLLVPIVAYYLGLWIIV